jgi:hypothetical protein
MFLLERPKGAAPGLANDEQSLRGRLTPIDPSFAQGIIHRAITG